MCAMFIILVAFASVKMAFDSVPLALFSRASGLIGTEYTKSNQFVEVPLSCNESHNNNIAASVRVGNICAEVHNGADEATLAALFRVLKSC